MVSIHNAERQAWPSLLFHKQGKQVWRAWGFAHGPQNVDWLPRAGCAFSPEALPGVRSVRR